METLELREPEGAFERLEYWLRERGFFAPGGERLSADLYLGYGLSQVIRRTATTAAAEPCSELPLLACRLRSEHEIAQHVAECRVGDWKPTWAEHEYVGAIERVRDAIVRVTSTR